jgi:hypothetical protein
VNGLAAVGGAPWGQEELWGGHRLLRSGCDLHGTAQGVVDVDSNQMKKAEAKCVVENIACCTTANIVKHHELGTFK